MGEPGAASSEDKQHRDRMVTIKIDILTFTKPASGTVHLVHLFKLNRWLSSWSIKHVITKENFSIGKVLTFQATPVPAWTITRYLEPKC